MESKPKKKLWLISQPFYPNEASTGFYVTEIAKGLAQNNFPVGVICGQSDYFSKVSAPRYELKYGMEIFRCWSLEDKNGKLYLRILGMLIFSFLAFVEILKKVKAGDSVFTATSPPLLPAFVAVASKIKGAKTILLVHDVYPGVLAASGLLKKTSLIYKLLNFFSKKTLKSFGKIIVIGRDMEQLLAEENNLKPEKIKFIPNWADTDAVFPRKVKSENKFVVQYSGNMGPLHDVKSLLDCANLLKENGSIHFTVLAFGSRKEWFESQVSKRGLKNISILSRMQRKDSIVFLNACDVVLSLFVQGMFGLAVPSRIYNVMAAGKPLVAMCDEGSEIARTIDENKIGWVVDPGDFKKLADVVVVASQNPEIVQEMSKNARLTAETKFSKEKIIKKYIVELSPDCW